MRESIAMQMLAAARHAEQTMSRIGGCMPRP